MVFVFIVEGYFDFIVIFNNMVVGNNIVIIGNDYIRVGSRVYRSIFLKVEFFFVLYCFDIDYSWDYCFCCI